MGIEFEFFVRTYRRVTSREPSAISSNKHTATTLPTGSVFRRWRRFKSPRRPVHFKRRCYKLYRVGLVEKITRSAPFSASNAPLKRRKVRHGRSEQNLWAPLDRRTPTIEATPKARCTLIKYLLSKGSYGLGAGPVRYLGTPGTIESFEEGRSCFDERRFEPPLAPRVARVRLG
jgi:hypothetical protein